MTEFQTDKKSLLFLLDQIDHHELALPDFQRDFVWESGATRELVSSIIRSFPAGALLLLQGGADLFKPRAFEQAPVLGNMHPPYLVLDGQQRLTSLYLAMTGQGTHRYFLNLGRLMGDGDDGDVDEAVEVLHATRMNKWATLEGQAAGLVLPLAQLRHWSDWRDKVLDLRPEKGDEWKALRQRLNEMDERYVKAVEGYQFPLTVLASSTSAEAVCTIFETLNRTGIKLSVFELLTARAYAHGVELRSRWAQSLSEHPILGDFDIDPYYLLQVIALLEGGSPKRSAVLALPVATMEKRWDEAAHGLSEALTMLREECGVLVTKWLPYQTVLLTLGAVWSTVTLASGPNEGAQRAKLQRYFWCSAFTGRYENAPNTVAEQDVPALRAWLEGGTQPTMVTDFAFDTKRWLETTVRQRALYRATIALSMSGGTLDFHSAKKLDHHIVAGQAVDDHHIFPRNYLAKTGQSQVVDSVVNHTLIDKLTNIHISDRPPSEYLTGMRDALGAGKLGEILRSHGLPDSEDGPLWQDRFEDFLDWRLQHLEGLLAKRAGE